MIGTTNNFNNKTLEELNWFKAEFEHKYPELFLFSINQLKNAIQQKEKSEARQVAELKIISNFIEAYKTKGEQSNEK